MIEIKNISYRYSPEAEEQALTNVSLTVRKGEFLAIVGHNGSGKSTLAKHLNALLLPTEGAVLVDGMDTKEEELTLPIRQKVGMVFQNPDNQIVTTIVEEDVGFGPENLGVDPVEIRERVDKALATVGMTEYATSAPHMLSGGQKQRIAIAGMLAMRPEVLVLDEATAMLDPKGRKEVLATVSRLNSERGMTVVMITQYMEEAVLADRVAVMAGGKLAMLGSPKEIFARADELRACGLDAPPMVELRDALMQDGIDAVKDAITVEEMADALCPLLLKN
ncbi:MAG: energy-coupling factor transporter ATPase [Clostridia bacterium]|nr:energy-coupling factor transporter ATPase [Clostridia bacterium]